MTLTQMPPMSLNPNGDWADEGNGDNDGGDHGGNTNDPPDPHDYAGRADYNPLTGRPLPQPGMKPM